jgi:hypothetical protein
MVPTDNPLSSAKTLPAPERNVFKTVQFVAEVAPEPLKYIPVAHNVQLSPASPMEILLAWHTQQAVALNSEKEPAGHGIHADEFEEPTAVENVPGPQLVHDVAPVIDAKVPDLQGMQLASDSTPILV